MAVYAAIKQQSRPDPITFVVVPVLLAIPAGVLGWWATRRLGAVFASITYKTIPTEHWQRGQHNNLVLLRALTQGHSATESVSGGRCLCVGPSLSGFDMNRSRWVIISLVAAVAISGLAIVMLSGNSVELMMTGGALLLLAGGGGFILALSAMWRNYTEPTTLTRPDGPILLTVEQ